MKRLTTKVDDIYTCSYCENQQAVNRLAEFEDFLEEMGFDSIEEIKDIMINLAENLTEKLKDILKLEDRWQKLKEFIGEQSNPIDNLVVSDNETKYIYMSDILDEMQELEKE